MYNVHTSLLWTFYFINLIVAWLLLQFDFIWAVINGVCVCVCVHVTANQLFFVKQKQRSSTPVACQRNDRAKRSTDHKSWMNIRTKAKSLQNIKLRTKVCVHFPIDEEFNWAWIESIFNDNPTFGLTTCAHEDWPDWSKTALLVFTPDLTYGSPATRMLTPFLHTFWSIVFCFLFFFITLYYFHNPRFGVHPSSSSS